MNPTISKISEENSMYRFTLSGLNVSLANALRRTILSDIPINTIFTEVHSDNDCHIETNTSRLHNEILKQRLSCIPIHNTDLEALPGKYQLEIDVENTTDHILFVTTEDFKIKNKETGNYLTETETRKIFPPDAKTSTYYIDFARLRPKMGDMIHAEKLKLTAEFSIHCAKDSSMFNAVSICSYGNTPDSTKITESWGEQAAAMASSGASVSEIAFQKENYRILDSQRQYIENSFDFVIKTIGIYTNVDLVKKASSILQNKFVDMAESIESDLVPIMNSETTMESCFDIILEGEDYTMGKVLEYFLYEKFYQGEKTLSYCGFKKFHPHNPDSILRIAFVEPADKNRARQYLRDACIDAQEVYKKIYALF